MPVYRTGDGAELAYADQGKGPVVLLIHGWAAHGGFFSALSTQLARDCRVITPTLRGHAGSERGARPLTIETLGEDILALADALELDRFSALGWSMGAMALWAAAPQLKERLGALIIEEMSPKIVNDASWPCGLSGGYSRRNVETTLNEIDADWPAYVARLAPRMFAPATAAQRPEIVAHAAAEMRRADPGAMGAFWRSMAGKDFRAALTNVRAPVLAIHGAESQIYPEGATDFVARTTQRGRAIVLAGAGHVPHLEAPDAFLAAVHEFLATNFHVDPIKTS